MKERPKRAFYRFTLGQVRYVSVIYISFSHILIEIHSPMAGRVSENRAVRLYTYISACTGAEVLGVPSPVYTGSVLCGFWGLGGGTFRLITCMSAHRSVRVQCTLFGCHRPEHRCFVYLSRSYLFAGLIISAAPRIHALLYVQYPASCFRDLFFALLDLTSELSAI